ncbi:hypothetical protein ACS5NO_05960 [Larkinella sp. GY13]|uniref:hypothetical protein n=1 Tax=Larkinella sp. GY13 TaxID=3453720 RepID=UPI003EEC23F8
MFESIRSYLRLRRLAKALHESQDNQYTNQIDAMRACNRLFRDGGKEFSVVKHKSETLFWVVSKKSAEALVKEGHQILKPYK